MPHSDQDEKMIELFKQLPKVQDERALHEIYRNVNKKDAREIQRKPIFIPVLSSLLGLVLILLIVPTLFQKSPLDLLDTNVEIQNSTESEEIAMSKSSEDNEANMKIYSEDSLENQTTNLKTAVYEEDIMDQQLVTFGAVTDNAYVLPISVLRPKQAEGDYLANLEETMDTIDETAYGFQDVTPYINALSYTEKAHIAQLTIDEKNKDFFIMNEGTINDVLKFTLLPYGVNLVLVSDEQGNPVELGEYGLMDHPIELMLQNHKEYYAYQMDDGKIYLVPASSSSENLTQAIEKMKEAPNDYFHPVLPEAVTLQIVDEGEKEVTIEFEDGFDLEQGDAGANMRMIEGILLTAKEFGYHSVKFRQLAPNEWQGLNFAHAIQVPVAPNLLAE